MDESMYYFRKWYDDDQSNIILEGSGHGKVVTIRINNYEVFDLVADLLAIAFRIGVRFGMSKE